MQVPRNDSNRAAQQSPGASSVKQDARSALHEEQNVLLAVDGSLQHMATKSVGDEVNSATMNTDGVAVAQKRLRYDETFNGAASSSCLLYTSPSPRDRG